MSDQLKNYREEHCSALVALVMCLYPIIRAGELLIIRVLTSMEV